MKTGRRKGKCQVCGKTPRILFKIESGESVCRSCLREIRYPLTEKDFALEEHITRLRKMGFQVSDSLSRNEYHRLMGIYCLRQFDYPNLPYDTPADEVARLEILVRLQGRDVAVSQSASLDTLRAAEKRATEVRRLFTKVAGVSHKNRDGSDRQSAIARCRPMEALKLRHEADNPVDRNAVAIYRKTEEQLGYVSADLAGEVLRMSRQGRQYFPYVLNISGDGSRVSIRGLNIVIVIAEVGVSFQKVQEYIRENSQEWLQG